MLRVYTILCIVAIIHGCANNNPQKEKRRFGYCVGTEGIHFVHKMIEINKNSIDVEEKKYMLLQDIQKYYPKKKEIDANYYKEIIEDDNSLIIYGYSILNNDLRVIIRTDEAQKHIVYIKYFFPKKMPIECSINYKINKKTASATKRCNNNTKLINLYRYDEKNHYFFLENSKFYENNRVTRETIYKNGMVHNYDFKNKTTKVFEESNGFSDFCVPYILYNVDMGSTLGI